MSRPGQGTAENTCVTELASLVGSPLNKSYVIFKFACSVQVQNVHTYNTSFLFWL